MPDIHLLDDMQLFVAIVKNKSFSAAAEQLGLAKSTLSVRMQRLEQSIGLSLLYRTTRKLELTEAGQIYFNKAVNIINEAESLHLALDDMLSETAGVVKISVPIDFAYQALAEHLPEFLKKYPKIQIDIDVNPRRGDLIGEPFDVVFRTGGQDSSNLISRTVSRHQLALYASPDYLARYGTPQNLGELAKHHGIAFRRNEWRLSDGTTWHSVVFAHQVMSNNLGLGLRLAVAGMGVVMLPDVAVKNVLAAGQLVRVLPHCHGETVSVYALTATRLIPKKTQVLIDFLKEKLGSVTPDNV